MRKGSFVVGKIGALYLTLALCAAAAGFAATYVRGVKTPTPYRAVQRAAAVRMQRAEAVLLQVVMDEGIPMEADDANQTGLVGPEWTALTTTLGHLEAKRSALNPNVAALLVRYFQQAGLTAGDTVAIGTSGSFPGLSIATLCAATEMGLNARVIASFGSSMYGGTRVELTTERMMRIIRDAGVVDYALLAVSPGGNDDHGESVLYGDAREIIKGLAAQSGAPFIDVPTIEESIARRLALFGEDVDLFVNVGGASANSGTSAYTLDFPEGLVTDPPRIPTTQNRGLMYEYAARGVPVVNMLNVRALCLDNGLPYDPVPMPAPGEGDVYFDTVHDMTWAIAGLLLALALLAFGRLRAR